MQVGKSYQTLFCIYRDGWFSLFFLFLYSVTMLAQWITWLDFLMGNPSCTPRINANWEWFGLLMIHWGVLPLCPRMKSPSTFPSWHFFVRFCSQDDAASFKALCNVSFLFSVLWKSLCKTGVFPPISVWKNSQRKLSEPGVIYFVPAGVSLLFLLAMLIYEGGWATFSMLEQSL